MRRFLLSILFLAVGCFGIFNFIWVAQASAISDTQKAAIIDYCDSIKNNLKNIQKADARARVYLGGYYETILTKFIMPLNVRLVENNLSTAGFVENQNKFAEAKSAFSSDFISYQQDLEELVSIDCKNEATKFYEKLEGVRQKRKTVDQDVAKIRGLIAEHIKLVTKLKEGL